MSEKWIAEKFHRYTDSTESECSDSFDGSEACDFMRDAWVESAKVRDQQAAEDHEILISVLRKVEHGATVFSMRRKEYCPGCPCCGRPYDEPHWPVCDLWKALEASHAGATQEAEGEAT